ncbi:hypothetical protein, partial [Litchfieldia alkalitelluris]|uniref:hypothetical protein n=1 Tax=Litchfieldia alkalitelluris TaxID=304268 RepID=UPI0019654C18
LLYSTVLRFHTSNLSVFLALFDSFAFSYIKSVGIPCSIRQFCGIIHQNCRYSLLYSTVLRFHTSNLSVFWYEFGDSKILIPDQGLIWYEIRNFLILIPDQGPIWYEIGDSKILIPDQGPIWYEIRDFLILIPDQGPIWYENKVLLNLIPDQGSIRYEIEELMNLIPDHGVQSPFQENGDSTRVFQRVQSPFHNHEHQVI